MKTNRTLAFLTAAVISSCSIISVSAEEQADFKASVGLASSDMSVQNWNSDLDISEGENTVVFTPPKDKKGTSAAVNGIGLLVIDLEDCYFDIGTVSVNSIKVDGQDISFDSDAIIYGADDGMDNDNFRIELYNSFGKTAPYAPFDVGSITVSDSVEVVFTVSRDGYSGGKKMISGNTVENASKYSPLSGCTITAVNTLTDAEDVVISEDSDKFTLELDRGIYDVTFAKDGYVPRTVNGVRAGKSAAPASIKDVELRKLGDVNGDCKINVADISCVAGYVKQVKDFSDKYQSAVADVNKDGKVTVTDISAIAGDVKGIKKIK